jgi:hypothetical protein
MRKSGAKIKFSNTDKLVFVGVIGAIVYLSQKMSYAEAIREIKSYSITSPEGYTKEFVLKWGKAIKTNNSLFEFQGNLYSAYSASRI